MDGHPIGGLVLILICALFNIIVSSAVTAIENVNEVNARKRAEEGETKAKRLVRVIDHHKRFMTVTDIVTVLTLMGMGISFVGAELQVLIKKFSGENVETLNVFTAVFLSIIMFIIFVMLVEIITIKIPKKLAFRNSDTYSYSVAGIVLAFMWVLSPIAFVIEQITLLLIRIFGIKPSELEDVVTEEEIISIVNEGHESGILEADEAEMITNIFELDDKEVKDVMTHRKNVIAISADLGIEEALKFMLNENYSRFPVYKENIDDIVGILHLKDVTAEFMRDVAENIDFKTVLVRDIAKEAYFVPDTQNLDVLFHDMQAKKMHMAVAIDEYGQTAGIVAMEDILEEIVGDIQDEYDEEENKISSESEGTYIVHGDISLDELADETGIEFDEEDEEDFDTLNGLLISELDRIPEDNERATITYKGFRMDILETKNKMIKLVRMTKLEEEKSESLEEHSDENDNKEE